ncbi:MAG: serine/threonine-protein kinase [Candidatus Dormiibacterota bacterium]
MSIAPGTKLGQYEVQDFIGQGAMGLVYRAYHVQLERTGAVKVLQAIAPDPDATARFRHEAQAIAQMRHPNILNVYDFGEFDGTPYMIVEYIAGGSLANRLNQGPIDHASALKFLRGIAAGLDYAHAKGIVHRDVKPANVLLEPDDTPVLADFGLAKLLQGSSLKSMTGVTTGTPAYMAPEQVTGSRVGPASDRYSLATIAYEMLTGVIPFDGEGLMELLYAQVHREPAPPSSRIRSLGPRVDSVIMRGLAKDPAQRWESCAAFVDALSAALARKTEPAVGRTLVMAPVAAPRPAMADATRVMTPTFVDEPEAGEPITLAYPSPPPPAPAKRSHKRRWALAALAILIVLLVVGFAGYLVTRPKPVLSLSSTTVRAGDTVVVTASNLPPDQDGDVQLLSFVHSVRFHSDSGGNATVYLEVPVETPPGNHTVRVCWASTCHGSTTLHVLEPFVLPTPSGSGSPSPISSPTPSPTSTTPASPLPRSLALSAGRVARGGTMDVKGFHFSPVRTVALTLAQGTTNKLAWYASIGSDGTFLTSFTLPSTVGIGEATVRACDPTACASATFTVV